MGSEMCIRDRIEWSRKLENGWEARAIAVYNASGATIGAGEAQCLYTETKWSKRDDYALRGMAQTRAISRALRGPLGFVVQLAGFATTPADEMPTADEVFHENETARRAGTARPVTSANSGAPSPAPKTPGEIFNEGRANAKTFSYAAEDMVCARCGKKEFIRPYQGSFFCSKRDGGCGNPPKGDKWIVMSYAEFLTRQAI